MARNQKRKQKIKLIRRLFQHPCHDLAARWVIKILLDLEGWRNLEESSAPFHARSFTSNAAILKTIELSHLEDEKLSKKEFVSLLKQRQICYQDATLSRENPLHINISNLAALIGLNKIDQALLAFAAVIHSHLGLSETTESVFDSLTSEGAIQVLSLILDIPVESIRESLHQEGTLQRSGLLKLHRKDADYLCGKLELADNLEDLLFRAHSDVMEMLTRYFHPGMEPTLDASDYIHVADDLSLIRQYLGIALQNRHRGANILLYGPPGTGKTELARLISEMLKTTLFEISSTSDDGEALKSQGRLDAYQLSQEVLSKKPNTLLMFDEIEDAFPGDMLALLGSIGSDKPKKAWVNRLLEQNPVPSIWISNEIWQIDPAFLRRFDYALKVDNPPRNIREKILHKYLKATPVSGEWITLTSENRHLSPAMISRAAKVAMVIDEKDSVETERALERIMGNSLQLLGHSKKLNPRKRETISYRLDVLNPDVDIKALVAGIRKHPAGRICLYGPPGTGKTEFGQYAAKVLDKHLLIKRASDLLSMWVGDSEKNIAGMFSQAEHDDAILLLDEADSFLRDRKNAQHSWEVTQVNELLTQMEEYQGVFICSTNLVDDLDAASIRRFDLKIKFDYMRPEQACMLFRQVLKDQEVSFRMSPQWKKRISRLTNLTPGDFATVVRQNRMNQAVFSADLLHEGLLKESAFKEGGECRGIGFTAKL